jgi:hypothetical protein
MRPQMRIVIPKMGKIMSKQSKILFLFLILHHGGYTVFAQKIIKRINNYVLIDQPIKFISNELNVIRISNQNKHKIGVLTIVRFKNDLTAAKIIKELPGYTISVNDLIEIPKNDTSSNESAMNSNNNIGYYFDRITNGFFPYIGLVSSNQTNNPRKLSYFNFGGFISLKEIIYAGYQQSNIKGSSISSIHINVLLKQFKRTSPYGINFAFSHSSGSNYYSINGFGVGLSCYTIIWLTPSVKFIPEIGYSRVFSKALYASKPSSIGTNSLHGGATIVIANYKHYILFIEMGVGNTYKVTSFSLLSGFGIPF